MRRIAGLARRTPAGAGDGLGRDHGGGDVEPACRDDDAPG
jgi:hypothetical protein